MQDSFYFLIVGILMLIFSFPVLWMNEARSAHFETVMSRADAQCKIIKGGDAEEENNGCLVHYDDQPLVALGPCRDSDFNLKVEHVLRMTRTVEESQSTQDTDDNGNPTGNVTQTWTSMPTPQPSGGTDSDQDSTAPVPQVNPLLGQQTFSCDDGVRYGSKGFNIDYSAKFAFNNDILAQFPFDSSDNRPKQNEVSCEGQAFRLGNDGWFYTGSMEHPKPGDMRVSFAFLPEGTASILALQAPAGKDTSSFLPFRAINRGLCNCCGLSPEEEGELLVAQGQKTPLELGQEAQFGGIWWLCCCCCNVVACCCMGVLTPQVFEIASGSVSKETLMAEARARATGMVMLFRVVGWVMMWLGFAFLFWPFLELFTIIPWIGPWIFAIGSWGIIIVSAILTLIVALLIIAVAYMAFHPITALVVFAIAAGSLALPFLLGWAHANYWF